MRVRVRVRVRVRGRHTRWGQCRASQGRQRASPHLQAGGGRAQLRPLLAVALRELGVVALQLAVLLGERVERGVQVAHLVRVRVRVRGRVMVRGRVRVNNPNQRR